MNMKTNMKPNLKLNEKSVLKAGVVKALLMVLVVSATSTVFAKKVQYRKTQDVNFDGSDVDGQARSPDGAYVAQKRGIDFVPLYKVRKNFDDNIKESAEYVK
jgi:hypothetical protein